MNAHQTLFREALELGKKRNYSEAIVRLRRIVSETDEVKEAYLYLGRSYHALGAYPQAIDMLRRFVQLRPDSAAGFFFLGRTLLSAGEYSGAVRALRRTLSLRPDTWHAKSLLGYIYLKLGDSSRAVDLLGEAVEAAPPSGPLYSGYLNALLVEGIKSFKRGGYDYAEEVFDFIVSRGKKGILPHLYLGMIHRLRGEIEPAIEDYTRALDYSPDDELIIYRLGMLLLKSGREELAAEYLSRITRPAGDPDAVPARPGPESDRYLARRYFQRGTYSQALYHALQALRQRRQDAGMHLIAGESYRELGKYEQAKNHFTRIFDTDRRHIGAHYGIALIHWHLGEYRQMLGRLRKVEQYEPGSPTVHYYTVLCSWKLGTDPEKLLPVVQEAVRTFGPDAVLLGALADTYYRGGYAELAQKWYHKILEMDSGNIEAHRGLIRLHEEGETVAELEQVYDSYLSLVPDDHGRRRQYIHLLYSGESYARTIEVIESHLGAGESQGLEEELYLQRMRAICYRRTGDYQTAAELYRRLLRRAPEKEELLRPYIYCLEKAGKRHIAAETAEQAVRYLHSPSSTLCLIAGVLRYKEGETERALELFRKATAADPGDWRGFYNIGEMYRNQGMDAFAMRFFQQAETLKKEKRTSR